MTSRNAERLESLFPTPGTIASTASCAITTYAWHAPTVWSAKSKTVICANVLVKSFWASINVNNISVKPNVSTTGLAAKHWMIHMNPMGRKSFDSSSSKSRKSNKSNALAMLALQTAGAVQTPAVSQAQEGRGLKRSQSAKKKREMAFMAKRSQSVRALPYARRLHGGSASYVNVMDAAKESKPRMRAPSITIESVDETISGSGQKQSRISLPPIKPASSPSKPKRPPFARTQSVDCHNQARRSSNSLATNLVEVARSRSPARMRTQSGGDRGRLLTEDSLDVDPRSSASEVEDDDQLDEEGFSSDGGMYSATEDAPSTQAHFTSIGGYSGVERKKKKKKKKKTSSSSYSSNKLASLTKQMHTVSEECSLEQSFESMC